MPSVEVIKGVTPVSPSESFSAVVRWWDRTVRFFTEKEPQSEMESFRARPAAFSTKSRGAFTLIELLVVVGIIAILAAIALPNFLEAQVRAKISRVRADLRTVATAIEAYTVDHNAPPFDGAPGTLHYGWVNALSQLTTPVAFISSLPAETFQDDSISDAARTGHTNFLYGRVHTVDYSTAAWEDTKSDPVLEEIWNRNFGQGATWKITSPGPDRRFINDGSFYGKAEKYDPTNGTVSLGDIVRSNAKTD